MDKNEKRILTVDDDKTIREGLRDILELEGHSVDIAATGKEAIEKSEGKFFHRALVDIKLPDIEVTELLTRMQEGTPKIMVKWYPRSENAVEPLDLGADAYIMKPINTEKLAKVVEEKLKHHAGAQIG